MLRAEGIRVPGSKEGNFFRRFYRILYVGWFTTACLKIAEQRLFYTYLSFRMHGLYRDKSNNAFSSDRYHSYRYRSVLSRFSLILSRVCLLSQPRVSAFYTLCL